MFVNKGALLKSQQSTWCYAVYIYIIVIYLFIFSRSKNVLLLSEQVQNTQLIFAFVKN